MACESAGTRVALVLQPSRRRLGLHAVPAGISSLPKNLLFQEVFSARGVAVRVVVGFRLSSKLFRASPSGDSKGLARDSRRVQLGGTRGEGVAVQNSRVSVFKGMSETPGGGESPIKARGSRTVAHGSA